jgi:hypothetical protein
MFEVMYNDDIHTVYDVKTVKDTLYKDAVYPYNTFFLIAKNYDFEWVSAKLCSPMCRNGETNGIPRF